MNMKRNFISNNIKKPQIEEFLLKRFEKYGYSHSIIRKTHMGMDITIYANKPGLIIGRGGETINDVSEKLKKEFKFENIRIDVQEVENAYLNSKIVAEEIKNALERGLNFRRIGNIMLRKIIESGAIGTEIRLSGKLGSAKSRVQRFYQGYLKYSGDTAKKYVDYTKATAITKAGTIGIKVRIMKEFPETKIREIKEVIKEDKLKNLICPHCGKKYESERSLKIHIGQKHSDEKPEEEKTKPQKKVEKKVAEKGKDVKRQKPDNATEVKEIENVKEEKPKEEAEPEKKPKGKPKVDKKVDKNGDTEAKGNKKND